MPVRAPHWTPSSVQTNAKNYDLSVREEKSQAVGQVASALYSLRTIQRDTKTPGIFELRMRAHLSAPRRSPARWQHRTTCNPSPPERSLRGDSDASGASIPETGDSLQSPEKKLETARRRKKSGSESIRCLTKPPGSMRNLPSRWVPTHPGMKVRRFVSPVIMDLRDSRGRRHIQNLKSAPEPTPWERSDTGWCGSTAGWPSAGVYNVPRP